MTSSFESYLQQRVFEDPSGRIQEAMAYSLLDGGKRVRPNLLFACLKGYGLDEKIGYPCACAIEMIHTYSLIHDDLPAMDDDDFRRGKKSCHKQFDEATAILAGDGLLTKAFEVACDTQVEAARVVQCIRLLANYAGVNGMIYGQELDIQAEQMENMDIEAIQKIDFYKTGKLLTLPLLCASILANHDEDREIMEQIGRNIGLQFQILDDILDQTQSEEALGKSTSDTQNNKQTYVTLYGLNQAKEVVKQLENTISQDFVHLHMDTSYLEEIIQFLTKRTY